MMHVRLLRRPILGCLGSRLWELRVQCDRSKYQCDESLDFARTGPWGWDIMALGGVARGEVLLGVRLLCSQISAY